ncbi:MAG: hypothetical protein M1324_00160 [Patescibacteria group bacterium]|nr:hypothetical protein [Patescibacteria group bacterium]
MWGGKAAALVWGGWEIEKRKINRVDKLKIKLLQICLRLLLLKCRDQQFGCAFFFKEKEWLRLTQGQSLNKRRAQPFVGLDNLEWLSFLLIKGNTFCEIWSKFHKNT